MDYYVNRNNVLIEQKDIIFYFICIGCDIFFACRDGLHLWWQQSFSERIYLIDSYIVWIWEVSKWYILLFHTTFLQWLPNLVEKCYRTHYRTQNTIFLLCCSLCLYILLEPYLYINWMCIRWGISMVKWKTKFQFKLIWPSSFDFKQLFENHNELYLL